MTKSITSAMQRVMNNHMCFLLAFFMSPTLYAQPVPMADGFRAEGKIYVVLACILLLWLGFVVYLLFLGGKIHRLSKKIQDHVPETAEQNTEKKPSEEPKGGR